MPTTIELAGERFPTCALVCPPIEGRDESEWDRALGVGGNDHSTYVPAENGLLFGLMDLDDKRRRSLWLLARACYLNDAGDDDDALWLPQGVDLVDGDLRHVPPPENDLRRVTGGGKYWMGVEDDWVAETIQRLAHKPFVQPPGPEVTLVPADRFAAEAEAARVRTYIAELRADARRAGVR